MPSLNELIKQQTMSRNIDGKGIVILPKKKSCPGCNRKKLVNIKINNAVFKVKGKV